MDLAAKGRPRAPHHSLGPFHVLDGQRDHLSNTIDPLVHVPHPYSRLHGHHRCPVRSNLHLSKIKGLIRTGKECLDLPLVAVHMTNRGGLECVVVPSLQSGSPIGRGREIVSVVTSSRNIEEVLPKPQ